jgi:TolA-binding protein
MVPKFSALLVAVALALSAAAVGAPAPLTAPTPLVKVGEVPPPAGEALATLDAAQSAHQLGFPSLAADLYREVLNAPVGAGGDRAQIVLALVSALLDDGDIPAAAQALQAFNGAKNSTWHLRAGLIAAHERKIDSAKAELAAVKREELAPADVGWLFFLQGMVADAGGENVRASDAYTQAEGAAVSSLQRARFELARELMQLRRGAQSDAQLKAARNLMESQRGRKLEYEAARIYAVGLDASGRKNEAVEVLRREMIALPSKEREESDRFQLLLGLIAGADAGLGRNALMQLLSTGSDPAKQRVALQLLARASLRGPGHAELRARLNELISASNPHPILPELYLFRAQLALSEKTSEGYQQADADAKALLEKFPGSPLKAHAYGVLTSAAWEQRRYRTAADYAEKARAELPPGQTRAELGVLAAEAWFRSEDFRSAAEAYAAALRESPAGVAPGTLMFQRVLAEIAVAHGDAAHEGEKLLAVQTLLDGLARDPAFDLENRWQAEWNLSRALQVAQKADAAYARVNALLASPARDSASLPVDLRVRMAWLQARLSLDVGLPERTLVLADGLIALLDGLGKSLNAELRTQVASTTVLLRAQAHFTLARDSADASHEATAHKVSDKLRADFPNSDAAIYSYIVEADYDAEKDRIGDAQRLLVKLADDFPNSDYAPLALYRAALLDERRGEDRGANNRLEQLVTRYPSSHLFFIARLQQGDVLRKLNEFPQAELLYKSIIDAFPEDPNVQIAKMALAACHSAQVTVDPSHADRAREIYESVLAWPTAPADLRVEAGFKLGDNLERRGNLLAAEQVWWRDVVGAFLLKPEKAAELGATGRFWMSRTLLWVGDLRAKQSKFDEAKRAWQLILEMKLPGEGRAKLKLESFNQPEIKP